MITGLITEILSHKSPQLWTIAPDATVFEAIQLMAEKDIKGFLRRRISDGALSGDKLEIAAALVEMRQKPIFQCDGAALGAGFDPAGVRRDQRAASLGDGMADRRAAHQFAVEAIKQHPRRFDMHRMAHRQHAADACLNQPRCDRPEDSGLPHSGAAASFQHDERNLMLCQQVAQPIGSDKVGL